MAPKMTVTPDQSPSAQVKPELEALRTLLSSVKAHLADRHRHAISRDDLALTITLLSLTSIVERLTEEFYG